MVNYHQTLGFRNLLNGSCTGDGQIQKEWSFLLGNEQLFLRELQLESWGNEVGELATALENLADSPDHSNFNIGKFFWGGPGPFLKQDNSTHGQRCHSQFLAAPRPKAPSVAQAKGALRCQTDRPPTNQLVRFSLDGSIRRIV